MSFCWLLVYSWFIQCYVVSIFQVSIGGGSGTAAVAAVVTARAKLVCFAPQSRQNDALLYSANSMERRREAVAVAAAAADRNTTTKPERTRPKHKKKGARNEEKEEEGKQKKTEMEIIPRM